MTRSLMLAGAFALAIPSLALSSAASAQPGPAPADPSNPAGAPLSPTLDAANQPARGDDSQVVREAETTLSGAEAEDAETEADRQAREEAAKPKQTRTVRMGERTMAAGELPRR